MTLPPDESHARPDEISPLDDSPIVIHGPLHGSAPGVGLASVVPVVAPIGTADRNAAAALLERAMRGAADLDEPPSAGPPADGTDGSPLGGIVTESRRALGLDALRGFFLVLMTFSFTTHTGLLPAWLYHVQTPPPTFALVNAAGIGWPDLAYPAFIFAMAAALPIALSRRIDSGETEIGIILGAIRRFFLLFVFALLIGHANTYFIGYTQTGRALAVLGFLIMFALFVQLRPHWSERTSQWVSRGAWAAAILFLALSPLAYGSTFSPARRDEVIAYLAVGSLLGSVLWYFTRQNWTARLAVLGGIVALYLGARGEGWIQGWWWSSPAPWLFRPTDITLMTVVIPGTIAGDLILRWMRPASVGSPTGASAADSWSRSRVVMLALVSLAIMPVVVHGLYGRWVEETSLAVLLLGLVGAVLTWRPNSATERLLRDLFGWGAAWLLIGLFLEPSEGGIKKVPDTLSYFFTVTGVTMMLLVTLTAVVEILGRRKAVAALVDVGRNPMLCYVLYTVFFNSLLEMIPQMRGVLRDSPGGELMRALLSTITVVLVVRAFSRKKIFWRT